MILGMSTATYTLVHVIISLIGIVSGFVALIGMLNGKRLDRWNAVFLITTIATSVTGFGFPIHKIGPPHIVGVISLIVLMIAVLARYSFRLAGGWRRTYVITAAIALYLNVFVGVVQSFQKIRALNALAPKGSEPPFVIAQLFVIVLFVVLATLAAKRFREVRPTTAA
jgi:hypothetical protein